MSKKQISNDYFAISYILGIGVLAAITGKIIFFLLSSLGVDLNNLSSLVYYSTQFVIWLFSFWVGLAVPYWLLNKFFKVNRRGALKAALDFFIVIYLAGQGILIFIMSQTYYFEFYPAYAVIQLVISASMIYYLGKRYIISTKKKEEVTEEELEKFGRFDY